MEQYLINDLERLTGIKAHTIRIWEKRYALISPSRTATNRRFYNGDQLRKLMNVATLLANGHKISAVAGLSNEALAGKIEEMQTGHNPDMVSAAFIHDLTMAMLTFDEAAFERVFAAANTRFGFFEGMLQVFYPFLSRIGMLWSVDKAMPVQEHFANSIIRRKIIAATDGLKQPVPGSRKMLLYLPANEWHENGLLFANYIIRSRGIDTIYLGQNVPSADIAKVIGLTNPESALTFYISPKPKDEIRADINSISKENPALNIYLAGSDDLLGDIDFGNTQVRYLNGVQSIMAIF